MGQGAQRHWCVGSRLDNIAQPRDLLAKLRHVAWYSGNCFMAAGAASAAYFALLPQGLQKQASERHAPAWKVSCPDT
jgi:hypothetical protein